MDREDSGSEEEDNVKLEHLEGDEHVKQAQVQVRQFIHVITSHTEGFLSGLQLYLTCSYLLCTDTAESTRQRKKTPSVLRVLTICLANLFASLEHFV